MCMCVCIYIYICVHTRLKIESPKGLWRLCMHRVRAHENRLRAIRAGNTYTLPEGHEDNDVPSFWLTSLNMNPIPTNPIIQAPKA